MKEHVNTAKGAENELVKMITDVAPSEGPCEGAMARTTGAAKNTNEGPAAVNSAPLFDSSTITVPSDAAGVTQVAEVDDMIVARATLLILCPNLHSIPERKFDPKTVTMDPPVLIPKLGTRAVKTSAAAYSKEVETERSAPLFKTSSATTAGVAATGDTHMTKLSETNTAELDIVEPNLQRMALLKTTVTS